MRSSKVWAATGLLLTTLVGGSAKAGMADFTLVNHTEFTVYAVFVWPIWDEEMGPDRLWDDTIESGDTYAFKPAGGCRYNIRITLRNGYQKQWDDVDLCTLNSITLHFDPRTSRLWASTG